MFRFLESLRASLLVGQASKHLRNERYRDALERAERALTLDLNENFTWSCLLIAGKSRVHLGDLDRAEEQLRKAREMLEPRRERQPDSTHLRHILEDIERYLDAIERHRAGQSAGEDT